MKNLFYTLLLILSCSNLFGQQAAQICPSDELQRLTNNPNDRILVADPEVPNNPPPDGVGPTGPGDRLVFWMHGIGGNSSSWTRAATATEEGAPGFNARKIQSIRLDYSNEIYNIEGAGNKMKNEIRALTITAEPEKKRNNFIIAHSQGGIVSRQMDKFFDNPNDDEDRGYGGIVTFNSSHAGAQVINNVAAGALNEITTESCSLLLAGPAAEKIDTIRKLFNIRFLGGIINFNVVDEINKKFNIHNFLVGEFCEFLGTTLPPYIMSNLIKSGGITNDYAVGAPKISELAGHNNPDVQKVAFWTSANGNKWSNANDYLVWRTSHYFINSPNAENYFDAMHDQESIENAKENAASYLSKAEEWAQKAIDNKQASKYYYQLAVLAKNDYEKKLYQKMYVDYLKEYRHKKNVSYQYSKGIDWWATINDKYKTLIGALEVKVTNEWLCYCEFQNEITVTVVDHPLECEKKPGPSQYCWLELGQQFVSKKEFDSDGVVTSASQMAYPGAFVRNADSSTPTTHMQARNNLATKRSLNDLYSGMVGNFFKTESK